MLTQNRYGVRGDQRRNGRLTALAVALLTFLAMQTASLAEPQVTAFPDGDAKSGRFVNLANKLQTLGEGGTFFCIEVPTDLSPDEFLLQIFDGDYGGLWDLTSAGSPVVQYKLYADPDPTDGPVGVADLVAQWSSAQMPNDAWFTCTSAGSSVGTATSTTGVQNDSRALNTTDGVYRYLLLVTWQTVPSVDAMNSFKLRAQGRVFALKESRYGFIGFKWGAVFYGGGIPWTRDPSTLEVTSLQPARTDYDGYWHFHLMVPQAATVLDFWNGDFDVAEDNDDVHASGIPSWATGTPAVGEGANNGNPRDDSMWTDTLGNKFLSPYGITTPVAGIYQEVSAVDRSWVARETNPSGNLEWENFQVAVTGFGENPEYTVSALPPGHYHWEIYGVDVQNTLFLRPQHNLFGSFGNRTIGDRVWLDQDNSGGQDDLSEPGINGVTVNLYVKINGSWIFYDSKVTDRIPDPDNAGEFIDGSYEFRFLANGEYKVEVDASTLPGGLTQTFDLDGTSSANVAELTVAGTDRLDADFSYRGSGTIGDFIWLDTNGDGIQNDGPSSGIANVVVELWVDWEDDGSFILLGTDTTDANGNYLFTGLPAGTYQVVVDGTTLPTGLTLSYDPDGGLPNEAGLPLAQSGTNLLQDFGYTLCADASIGDLVWIDSDADGSYEPEVGELPVSGVCVELYGDTTGDGSFDVQLTATTDSEGEYLFENLKPGCYLVKVAAKNFGSCGPLEGHVQTYDHDECLDNKTKVVLDCGDEFLDADFGYEPKCPPGTGTPGYWMNHPEAWPVDEIVIGGVTYSKADAIAGIKAATKGDKTYSMFQALVSAKLNVGVGNDFSCVEETILDANAWMTTYPLGIGVGGGTAAWAVGDPLMTKLDDYNNGRLPCAYHRDSNPCKCGGEGSKTGSSESGYSTTKSFGDGKVRGFKSGGRGHGKRQ